MGHGFKLGHLGVRQVATDLQPRREPVCAAALGARISLDHRVHILYRQAFAARVPQHGECLAGAQCSVIQVMGVRATIGAALCHTAIHRQFVAADLQRLGHGGAGNAPQF
ncbi:hypothetical protein D3C71_1731000 [compost metagenome]